ncbi:hypothetical protein D3C86_650400 [compost metagenome]
MRNDEIAAEGQPALGQDPALVVGRGAALQARAVETVADAAKDLQITRRADHQRTSFARAVRAGLLRAGVDARVAVTRQVDVAVDVQVAVGVDGGIGVGHDLQPGAQVEALAVGAQPRKPSGHQRTIAERVAHERLALAVQAVEVSLVDHLVGAAVDRRVLALLRALVGGEGIDRDRPRAVNGNGARRVDGDVVAAAPRGVQGHRAEVPSRAVHTQVHARATGDGERAAARIDLDGGAVRRVDGLAVAVASQHARARVEHRAACKRHTVARGQADVADLLAAGIDAAIDLQVAAVHRDVDLARLEFVAEHQVAALELEAARAEGPALGQPRVQAGEVGDDLRAHVDVARGIGNQRSARVMVATAAGRDAPAQVHHACAGIQRQGIEPAGAVVLGRQVDARPGGLKDVTGAAFQHEVAAPAVLAHIEEIDLAPREIELRTIAEHELVLRHQAQLSAGQHHRRVQTQVGTRVEPQLGAERIGRHRSALRDQCAFGRGDDDATARADAVDRPGATGPLRGRDDQVAPAVVERLGGVVPFALRPMHGEAAPVVGADALAGVELHRGEAQCHAVMRGHAGGLGLGCVAEHDLAGIDHQASAAGARATAHDRAGRQGRAVPDQRVGFDACHVVGATVAMDGRRGQHELRERGLSGGRIER